MVETHKYFYRSWDLKLWPCRSRPWQPTSQQFRIFYILNVFRVAQFESWLRRQCCDQDFHYFPQSLHTTAATVPWFIYGPFVNYLPFIHQCTIWHHTVSQHPVAHHLLVPVSITCLTYNLLFKTFTSFKHQNLFYIIRACTRFNQHCWWNSCASAHTSQRQGDADRDVPPKTEIMGRTPLVS
jgi:hypothetical protein